jgi:hypothetical protein
MNRIMNSNSASRRSTMPASISWCWQLLAYVLSAAIALQSSGAPIGMALSLPDTSRQSEENTDFNESSDLELLAQPASASTSRVRRSDLGPPRWQFVIRDSQPGFRFAGCNSLSLDAAEKLGRNGTGGPLRC